MENDLIPWTEKYRPNNIENLVGKEQILIILEIKFII